MTLILLPSSFGLRPEARTPILKGSPRRAPTWFDRLPGNAYQKPLLARLFALNGPVRETARVCGLPVSTAARGFTAVRRAIAASNPAWRRLADAAARASHGGEGAVLILEDGSVSLARACAGLAEAGPIVRGTEDLRRLARLRPLAISDPRRSFLRFAAGRLRMCRGLSQESFMLHLVEWVWRFSFSGRPVDAALEEILASPTGLKDVAGNA